MRDTSTRDTFNKEQNDYPPDYKETGQPRTGQKSCEGVPNESRDDCTANVFVYLAALRRTDWLPTYLVKQNTSQWITIKAYFLARIRRYSTAVVDVDKVTKGNRGATGVLQTL